MCSVADRIGLSSPKQFEIKILEDNQKQLPYFPQEW